MSAIAAQTNRSTRILDRRRIYILPTRHGVILAILLFAILLGSINYDNALGYVLTFLLSGLYFVAMLHTYRNLAGLKAVSFNAEEVFVNEYTRFEITLNNLSGADKVNLKLAAIGERKTWLKSRPINADCQIPVIGGQATVHTALSLRATARGWQILPKLKISSNFPLGIFTAWGYFPHSEKCLVYPKPDGALSAPTKRYSSATLSSTSGIGDADFRGLRPYSAGDPVKRIAWKSLAKSDEPMVKQFSGDGESQLLFEWHHTRELKDTEARLSQLCAWIVQANHSQLSYGLVLPNQSIGPASGEAHLRRCLCALGEY